MCRKYFVSVKGNDYASGSEKSPFQTISKAASVAKAGDTVYVGAGIYRECVSPNNGGTSQLNRITYQAIEGEKVIIKGSEEIKGWENVEGSVWKKELDNIMFGDYNPYAQTIDGDWILEPTDWKTHTGDVYLNGKSLYEAKTLEDVVNPVKREFFDFPDSVRKEYIYNPQDTLFQWYAKVNEKTTKLYANFHGMDPNKECIEINVRKCCFYPKKSGLNYITVRGFEMAHAATTWAPPTAHQVGMIGTHWSKGWIIENNILHDAKCSAVSLGKEGSTGEQLSFEMGRKSGYECQMESVFSALKAGWSKEKIGSHVVRNNRIYNCGQNAIVGHLGCAFSEIYGNHIFHIGIKHEFFGWEIAGIKLHAAIDTQIYQNCIHDCTAGIWLDWQAQGARISKNLFYRNDRDGMIEVTHGPLIIDHNIFASKYGIDNVAQGTAFVNNLMCGCMYKTNILNRATPYHVPHSTDVLGYAFVYGGDDRYYNNIFIGNNDYEGEGIFYGTDGYDLHTDVDDAYFQQINDLKKLDHERFFMVHQPVYIHNNAYLNGANPYKNEIDHYKNYDFNPNVQIVEKEEGIYLEMELKEEILEIMNNNIDSYSLGKPRIVDSPYDSPNGEILELNLDYKLKKRKSDSCIGPFSVLKKGKNRIKIWENFS